MIINLSSRLTLDIMIMTDFLLILKKKKTNFPNFPIFSEKSSAAHTKNIVCVLFHVNICLTKHNTT